MFAAAVAAGDSVAAARVFARDAYAWGWPGDEQASAPASAFIETLFETSGGAFRGAAYSYEIVDALIAERFAVVFVAEFGQLDRTRASVFSFAKTSGHWIAVSLIGGGAG